MIYTHAAAAVIALAAGFAVGWQVQGWRHGAIEAERVKAEQRDRLVRIERADSAATRHERSRESIRAQQRAITREVEHVVERPMYRDVCLDDAGLRLVAAAVGASGAGESAPAVPAASAAR